MNLPIRSCRTTAYRVALAIVLCAAFLLPARAEPRVALVIGNGAYTSVSSLDNPANDARMIAKALADLDFKVTLLVDADLHSFRQAIAAFGRDLRAGGPETTGLFYYAGHGLQSFQSNYLLPVDAELTDAADIDLVGIQADAVLRQMSSAKNRTNIVILDACRNNPFENLRAFDSAGLAEMKAPTGTFLAYATEPGMVALDGSGANSPFTAALVQALPVRGMPIEQTFKSVRVAVLEATGGRQTPWDSSSLTADFQFAPGLQLTAEDQLWEGVKASRDPMQIMLYMRAYPDGAHFDEARALLAEVMQFDVAAAGAPRAAGPSEGEAAAPVAAAPPAPAAAAGPSGEELAAMQAARAAGSVAAWEEFLARFPASSLREFAESELAASREKAATEAGAAPAPSDSATQKPPLLTLDIFFDQPLQEGGETVEGKRLADIIHGSPIYPPFEGIPDELWKGQSCSNCHQWNKEALCEQGKFYAKNNIDDGLGEIHPDGGALRRVMRVWAEQGCR